jgi:hypothetical protein
MTPTESILSGARREIKAQDRRGRIIVARRFTALDTLRLLKAAGPDLSRNEAWLRMAMLAAAVTSIDSVPVPAPGNEAQIEAIVEKLGEEGLEAVADILDQVEQTDQADPVPSAGN